MLPKVWNIFWNQPLTRANLDPIQWELEEKERASGIKVVSEQSGVLWVMCMMLHYKAIPLIWLTLPWVPGVILVQFPESIMSLL